MKRDTSWGEESVVGHYQKTVILPNLTRLVAPKKGEVILDLGCGEGYFAKKFASDGARVIGLDNSKKLIALAQKTLPAGPLRQNFSETSRQAPLNIEFHAWSADSLHSLKDGSVDKITIILAVQNMDNIHSVFKECHRVLKPNGPLYIVMNHPAFRIPKASDWAWDPAPNPALIKSKGSGRLIGNGTSHRQGGTSEKMFRKIYQYMSESKAKIEMHPSHKQVMGGTSPLEYTVSFHRPLQFYFKLLKNGGFCVTTLEEWISDKKSGFGPRAQAENQARKEIPLFLFLEAKKQVVTVI